MDPINGVLGIINISTGFVIFLITQIQSDSRRIPAGGAVCIECIPGYPGTP